MDKCQSVTFFIHRLLFKSHTLIKRRTYSSSERMKYTHQIGRRKRYAEAKPSGTPNAQLPMMFTAVMNFVWPAATPESEPIAIH